jgi:hypothetical protein
MVKLRSDQSDSVSVDLHHRQLNGDGRLLSFGHSHTCARLRRRKSKAAIQGSWDTGGSRPILLKTPLTDLLESFQAHRAIAHFPTWRTKQISVARDHGPSNERFFDAQRQL